MTPTDQLGVNDPDSNQESVARAFGAENRARLLARYFNNAREGTTETAWQHV
jgi:hypothetical protein